VRHDDTGVRLTVDVLEGSIGRLIGCDARLMS
jgi:hypothetical protein